MLKETIYKISCAEVWTDETGVLWLKPDPDTELGLDEVRECFSTYSQMGIHPEKKVLQIIDARINVSMNREGREFAAKAGRDYFLASAVISSSLSVRLIVNFFNMFYKADVPLKMFETEEEARKWLVKFRVD